MQYQTNHLQTRMSIRVNNIRRNAGSIWSNLFWKNPPHLWALKVSSIAFLLPLAELLLHNSLFRYYTCLGCRGHGPGRDRRPPAWQDEVGSHRTAALPAHQCYHRAHPPLSRTLYHRVGHHGVCPGAGRRHRLPFAGVTSGALLILVYTMCWVLATATAGSPAAASHSPGHSLLGGLNPAALSSSLLKPLNDHLSYGFRYLAEYIELKASLFPSNPAMQRPIRNQLAQKNTRIGTADRGLQERSLQLF